MIQRLQTIFLALVTLAMTAAFFFPFWEKNYMADKMVLKLNAFHLDTIQNSQLIHQDNKFYIGIMILATIGMAIFSIFQYKDRLKQMKLGLINSLLMSAVLGTIIFATSKADKIIAPELRGEYQISFYLVVFAMVCNLLANRFIRKDEQLVRSADRIR